MVMKKEMQSKNSDFMCVCSMCANYQKCLAEDNEQEKFIKEICLDTKSAGAFVWITAIIIGIFLGYAWHFMAVKDQINKKNAQIQLYEIALDDFKQSKEMKAIKKCGENDFWQAECIAWELNNAGK